jgi:hypothetical protein
MSKRSISRDGRSTTSLILAVATNRGHQLSGCGIAGNLNDGRPIAATLV